MAWIVTFGSAKLCTYEKLLRAAECVYVSEREGVCEHVGVCEGRGARGRGARVRAGCSETTGVVEKKKKNRPAGDAPGARGPRLPGRLCLPGTMVAVTASAAYS